MKHVENYLYIEENQNLFNKVIYYLFAVFLLTEPLSKVLSIYIDFRIKVVFKLILLLLISAYAIKIKSKTLLSIFVLIIVFFLGQFFLTEKHSVFYSKLHEELLRGDIYFLIKYLFVFIFIAGYKELKSNHILTKRLTKLLILFLIINSFFIIIGLITKLNFFKSYPYTNRFGSLGLIQLAGEGIHLYVIGIFVAYVEYRKTKKYLVLFFLIFGAIMLGKKAILIFLFLLFIIHLYYLNYKKILLVIMSLLVGVLIYSDKIISIFVEIFPFWKPIYYENGTITVIFSTRDLLFENCLHYINENWNVFNYLFGGIDFLSYRSELGFFDLFLTFGVVGTFTYLYFFYKHFFSSQTQIVKLILTAVLVTEAFSGGLLINILPTLFLYITLQYLKIYLKE